MRGNRESAARGCGLERRRMALLRSERSSAEEVGVQPGRRRWRAQAVERQAADGLGRHRVALPPTARRCVGWDELAGFELYRWAFWNDPF
jgi:hypothetical protein